jgi:hypothetical protein
MLSLRPYFTIYDDGIFLEVNDPAIKREYFSDPEGLRWDKIIKPKYIRIMTFPDILIHHLADLRENAQKERSDTKNVKKCSIKEYHAKRHGYIQAIDDSIGKVLWLSDKLGITKDMKVDKK